MKTSSNVRFLALLVTGTILFAGGVHLLHGYQVQRNAGVLLFQAERARDQGRLDLSAKYLQRYLGLAPDDKDVLATLALTFDELATTRGGKLRAFLAFEQALRCDPARLDLRRRLVQVAMELHRHADAIAHLEILLNAKPGDGDLQYLLGRCEEARGNYALAAAAYEKTNQLAPAQLESYLRRAVLLRQRLNQPELADQVMADMVRRNDGFQALLFRTRYYRELGMLSEAEMDLAAALEKAPHDAGVLLTAAELSLQAGHRDRARRFVEEGLERHASDWRMHQAAAELELADGKPDQAIARARRGLKICPNQPDLLATLAELLVEHHQAAEAEQTIARLRKQRYSAGASDYLEARVCMEKEKWREAVQLLERARPLLASRLALQRQADLSLSRCYVQLGDPERQLAVCRRAVAGDPSWLPARLELVAMLVASGRIEQALAEQRQITALPGAPISARVTLARLLIVQNQRLPLPQRDWREIDRLVSALEKAAPGSLGVVLVRADALVAGGQIAEARELLKKACIEHPKELGPWLALADLAQGDASDPLQLLDVAVETLGDSAPLRLARLKHSIPKQGKPDAEQLALLEDGIEQFSNEEQAQLFRALADAQKRLGESAEAERLWIEAAGRRPGDLRVRVSLFELALQNGDGGAMERWLKEIRAVEGGPLALCCEAAKLIAQAARSKEKAGLAKARELVNQAATERPGLPMLLLCAAQIAELEGNPDRAIECYRQVVEKDNAHPDTLRRLLHLLQERRRHAEADQVVAQVIRNLALRELSAGQDRNANYAAHYARGLVRRGELDEAQLWCDRLEQTEPNHLQNLEIKVRLLVARTQLPQALELLEDFVKRESARAGGEVEATRLAALLLDDLSRPEAERFYRRHVELRAESALALVSFLGRQRRTQEALDLCDQAWKTCPPAAVAGAAIAVLRSGPSTPEQQQRVENWLEAAVKMDSPQPALLAFLADLRDLQGRWQEAEALYRQVLQRDPRHVIALNNLAWFLVARDAAAAAEALEIVNRAIALAGPAPELLDTRALALLALGRTEQAIADLQAAVAERPTPGKQFHLARAYLLANKKAAARTAWQQAVAAGLQPDKLHALELNLYRQTANQMEP